MDKLLRLAVIGAGSAGRSHLRMARSLSGIEVVAVADIADQWRADAEVGDARRYKDPAAMCAEVRPDLVVVCTPTARHAEHALLGLQAGAHLLCEKPMAMNLAEARGIEAERARRDLRGAVNFSQQGKPALAFARDLIQAGELGRIRRISAAYLQGFQGAPSSGWGWRNDRDQAGHGALGDLGVHVIDAIRHVTGQEFRSVCCLRQTAISEKPAGGGQMAAVTTDTNAAFLAETSDKASVVVEVSQVAAAHGDSFRLEVSGEWGALAIDSEQPDGVRMAIGRTLTRHATWKTDLPFHRLPSDYQTRVAPSVLAALVASLCGRPTPYPDFEDGLRTQAVLDALAASADSRVWRSVD